MGAIGADVRARLVGQEAISVANRAVDPVPVEGRGRPARDR